MSKNGFTMATSRDALQTVSDAWDIALQAAKDGASHAKASAGDALPAAGRFLSRLVYTMSYSFSYGTVFPVAFIARSIPANNPIVTGMIDGAKAANDWVDELKHREPATTAKTAKMSKTTPPPTATAKRGRPRGKAKTTKKRTGRS
jgi:hypothetical protein